MLKMYQKFVPFMKPDDNPPGGGSPSPTPNSSLVPRSFTEEYVSALRSESSGYRTQLRSLEKVLGTIKAHFGLKDSDQVDDWGALLTEAKTTNERAVADALAKGKQFILQAEVKAQAATLGFVDSDAAMALSDLSKVQVADDGKVTGVKEALEALLNAKPYLKGQSSSSVGSGTNPPTGNDAKNPFAKDSFNLTEQGRLWRENPALAQRLQAEAR